MTLDRSVACQGVGQLVHQLNYFAGALILRHFVVTDTPAEEIADPLVGVGPGALANRANLNLYAAAWQSQPDVDGAVAAVGIVA